MGCAASCNTVVDDDGVHEGTDVSSQVTDHHMNGYGDGLHRTSTEDMLIEGLLGLAEVRWMPKAEVCKGVTPSELQMLTTLSQLPKDGSEHCGEECSLCLECFQPGDEMRTLRCLHYYHAMCIDDWLSRATDCPICCQCISVAKPGFIQSLHAPAHLVST